MNASVHSWLSGDVTTAEGPIVVEQSYETHTCHVFLDDSHAFKVRKPVDLGFLDYSSRVARWQATQQELILGRRISPQVYLGIWNWDSRGSGQLTATEQTGEPVLVMHRLPGNMRADHILAQPDTPVRILDPAIISCGRFHQDAPVDRRPDGFGSVENTVAAWTINFEQLPADDPSVPLQPTERRSLEDETAAWIMSLRPVLQDRIAAGRIRDGHGDLRLEHVYLTNPWSVVDPLEFSRALRFCDVAAEVGFLAMECDEMGRPDVGNHILQEYAEYTSDANLSLVAPFFKRYRAVVRAKIEWITALQSAGADRDAHLKRARRLFELALSYTL